MIILLLQLWLLNILKPSALLKNNCFGLNIADIHPIGKSHLFFINAFCKLLQKFNKELKEKMVALQANLLKRMYFAVSKSVNRIVIVQECDARVFNRSSIAGYIKIFYQNTVYNAVNIPTIITEPTINAGVLRNIFVSITNAFE